MDVIERRLEALPADTRALLETHRLGQAGRFRAASPPRRLEFTSDTYAAMAVLVTERLVRLRETETGRKKSRSTTYRLRQTIVRSLSADQRRAGHLVLARALDAAGGIDAAVLATHFQEGGDSRRGGPPCVRRRRACIAVAGLCRAAQFLP